MLVSVAIPTYFGAATVLDTVRSVVGQSIDDIEIVVSDDASEDATLDIVAGVADPRIRVLANRTRVGPAGNWNRALNACRGEYVKVLAQDDLLYPNNIRVASEALDANPAAALASVKRDIIGFDGIVLMHNRGLTGMSGLVESSKVARRVVRAGSNLLGEGSSVLFRRSAAQETGSFDDSLPYVIDIDYWLRLSRWGPVVAIAETHAAFRVSGGSWSNSLVREQGRQFVALINKLDADPLGQLSPLDVRIGKVRSHLNSYMRQAFYARYRGHL